MWTSRAKGPMGTPRSKLQHAKVRQKAVELAATGMTFQAIADALSVKISTLRDYRERIPGFEDALLDARMKRIEKLGLTAMEVSEEAMKRALNDEKPLDVPTPIVVATLRAFSPTFAAARKEVELTGSVDFGGALDRVIEKRRADDS